MKEEEGRRRQRKEAKRESCGPFLKFLDSSRFVNTFVNLRKNKTLLCYPRCLVLTVAQTTP